MSKLEDSVEVKRIYKLDENRVGEINKLLDEGVVWDANEAIRFLKNESNALFVAYLNNTAVGFLSAYRLQRFDNKRAEVLIYEVGVDEAYHRRGIGTALISSVKKWARETGADQMWVVTNKSNLAAMGLYRSTGGFVESDDEQVFVYEL